MTLDAANPRWYERFPRAVPVAIFSLTMTFTALTVFVIERIEAQRETAELGQTAQAITSALERNANASAAYLRSGAALFATQQVVAAPLFQTFISQLHLENDFLGADGVGWGMRVDRAQISEVEQGMRRYGVKQFTISPKPADDQAYAVTVMYLQPKSDRNTRALGFNMFSESIRRAAMQEAEKFGRPTASGKIVLAQEEPGSSAPGFLIYMPVFEMKAGAGRRTIQGFVYSPFNAERFLTRAVGQSDADPVGIRLYDQSVAPANLMAEIPVANPSGQKVQRTIDLANRRWIVEVEASGPASLSRLSILTLIFGLLVASLLLVLARFITQQAVEDRLALGWFEQQASIRNSLTRELNHRVKNTLANVLSIIALTRRRAGNMDEFVEGLEGRIRALSATHDLLTQSDWGATPVRAVINAEMAPYAQGADCHLELDGPDVDLAPNDALSLGLAIHELATNAAKYGALSVIGGKVKVNWHLITQDLARIEWTEIGGPPLETTEQRKRGFGMDLIEKIVAHELRNPVDLRFEPTGVRCSLIIPVRRHGDFAIRAAR